MEILYRWIDGINDVLWSYLLVALLLGCAVWFTLRTRGVQFRMLGEMVRVLGESAGSGPRGEKHVSSFQAFAVSLASRVGTGNLAGVATAIVVGGPGAVFWMWVSAFFGMITNYAENVLGLYFRQKDKKGNFSGGAFYYISNGLGWKWLGYVAAVFCMLAALGMSGAQTNKISGTLTSTFGVSDSTVAKIIVGIAIAAFTAIIIIGGIKRIGRVASMLVPFMSLLFIVLALIAICMNISALPKAFSLIFSNIFGFEAMAGGFGGYLFSQVIKKGMARGVFSNEAGLGSSVIAHFFF